VRNGEGVGKLGRGKLGRGSQQLATTSKITSYF